MSWVNYALPRIAYIFNYCCRVCSTDVTLFTFLHCAGHLPFVLSICSGACTPHVARKHCAPNVTGSVLSCRTPRDIFFSMACTEVPGFTSHRCVNGVIFLNACVLVCCTRRFRPEQVFWHSSAHVVHFTLTLQKHVFVTLSLTEIQGARSHDGVAPYALQMAPSFQPVSRGRICALTLATCNVAIFIVFVLGGRNET